MKCGCSPCNHSFRLRSLNNTYSRSEVELSTSATAQSYEISASLSLERRLPFVVVVLDD